MSAARALLTKGLRAIKSIHSTVHAYNCLGLHLQYNVVLLFAIYKSLYDSRT